MTEADKQLLLQDLASRLPYKPAVFWEKDGYPGIITLTGTLYDKLREDNSITCRPFLRSLSTMTNAELDEFKELYNMRFEDMKVYITICNYTDWLNLHDFDYRGLIEKGLACEKPKV